MMTRDLERRLGEAVEMAKSLRHEFVTLEHILYALLTSTLTKEILEGVGVNMIELKRELKSKIDGHAQIITEDQIQSYGGFESWNPELTLACHRLFQRAAMQVRSAGKDKITEGHLLVALFFEQDSFAVHAISKQGITQFDIINFVAHGIEREESKAAKAPLDIDGKPKEDAAPSSALDLYCVNLNEKAKNNQTDPLVGRDDVLERVIQVFCRRTKNNPLLIGEPGVGKTAIADGLAQRIVKGEVPEPLKDKIVFSLDMGSLLAGTKFRGDFEGRLKNVIKEIKALKRGLLFIDEIHTLVGAGSTSGGSMDASNLLKPALASGEIACMGSTTHAEYRQHFEKDRALARRFQRIDVKEPTPAEALQILEGLKSRFEEHHRVSFEGKALQAAVELSNKYIHGKLLPDKAIDVMDEAGAWARLNEKQDYVVTEKDIEQVIAKMAQIPAASISANDKEQLRDLDKKLKALIFGQDEAIERLVTSIKLSRSGLGRENKPIGCYLFTGPTGVGKTEVCKQLAQVMGIPFLRFDMSEYMEKHSVARLIGAPPGYVGHEEGGQLTEAVNRTPYAVLLLDEFEKAHPDVFNSLLQVMDAGRLTDSMGRTTDFRNVILIMTSNAGAQDVARGSIGLVQQKSQSISQDAIKRTFSPEFLNRLDAVVSFQDLGDDIVLRVVAKFVNDLRMLLMKKNVELVVDPLVLDWIKTKAYDKVYGARPFARFVDEHLKKPLVDELLFGRLSNGGRVRISLKDSALQFDYDAGNIPQLAHSSAPHAENAAAKVQK